jgi:hypothetical protein
VFACVANGVNAGSGVRMRSQTEPTEPFSSRRTVNENAGRPATWPTTGASGRQSIGVPSLYAGGGIGLTVDLEDEANRHLCPAIYESG